jgi:hypothetical protein
MQHHDLQWNCGSSELWEKLGLKELKESEIAL